MKFRKTFTVRNFDIPAYENYSLKDDKWFMRQILEFKGNQLLEIKTSY
jgi:hypothetical protein